MGNTDEVETENTDSEERFQAFITNIQGNHEWNYVTQNKSTKTGRKLKYGSFGTKQHNGSQNMSDNAAHSQAQKVGDRSEHEDNNNNDQTEGYWGQLGRKRSPWGRSQPDLGILLDKYNAKDREGKLIEKDGQETVQVKKPRI